MLLSGFSWDAARIPLLLRVAFRQRSLLFLGGLLAGIVLLVGCSGFGEEPPPDPPPLFGLGEYGGSALEGTEELTNLRISPDGNKVVFSRARPPGDVRAPDDQLWIVDRDGSNPQLIGVNIIGAQWSPDGSQLALTVWRGVRAYMFTLDLASGEYRQWSGDSEAYLFSKPTASARQWFNDGESILVSVWGGAYQQPFPRGTYVMNVADSTREGPLVELMQASHLGNDQQYIIGGRKYTGQDDPKSGNAVRYDVADGTWHWITDLPHDSLVRHVDPPVPSPTRDQLVQSRRVNYAKQLFLMDHRGENVRQITEHGGENPRWTPDGDAFLFKRDVHQGEGARYIPYRFDLTTQEAEPLWPALPDSVPEFPPTSNQEPLFNPDL